MKNNPILYFAYGMNLDMVAMKQRCPGCQPLHRASLLDHRLVFRGVADIEPEPGSVVQGALYKLSSNHLLILDRLEGCPQLYTRREIEVSTEDQRRITATVYQMTRGKGYSPPSSGYLEIILSGCRQWEIPETYVRSIVVAAARSHFGDE